MKDYPDHAEMLQNAGDNKEGGRQRKVQNNEKIELFRDDFNICARAQNLSGGECIENAK